jgi:chromosomal replication initiator protein
LPASVGYSAPQIWDSTLAQLLLRVTRQNYETWLRNTVGLRFEGTTLVVGTPNELASDWLATRMRTVICQSLATAAGPGLQTRFESVDAPEARDGTPRQPTLLPHPAPPLNPRFHFQSFLPLASNELALSAARALTGDDLTPHSPLFITGEGGSGKTHLLHAIAHEASKQNLRFVLVSAEHFLNDFTNAMRTKGGAAFRSRYRELDVLLVDDVHQLLGKKATTSELYQTVAGLHDEGRLVAVTGDLSAMSGEAERFQTELRWGLVAHIETPTAEDRVRFVQRKATAQGIDLPDEVQHYLALRVRAGLRELEGAVNRVAALARISRDSITIDFAARALQPVGLMPGSQPQPQPTDLLQAVCRHLELTPDDIRSPSRDRALTYARHVAMYLLRQDGGMTYSAIASLLNRKDHSTVVHACNTIHNELGNSPPVRADVDAIRASVRELKTAI